MSLQLSYIAYALSTIGAPYAIAECASLCRHHGDDRNGYDRNGYGRKLTQNVGQIVCDALGNCDDGHGRRYYDENHDNRCALAWLLGILLQPDMTAEPEDHLEAGH